MFDAIVLAGGDAARLGGVDKPALDVGGRTLLHRVVSAARAAATVVVVGPPREDLSSVRWCREDPPGGGPVAAIAAGLEHVSAERVLVLAADLPAIAGAVPALLTALDRGDAAALDGGDAAVLVDASGRRNHLAAAWRTAALRGRVGQLDVHGAAARSLYDGVRTVEVPDPAGWGVDCDTWDDVTRARDRAATDGSSM